ncbi:uncharacterized protein METZ01_LOCUS433770, partial [marine metagenome]
HYLPHIFLQTIECCSAEKRESVQVILFS